MDTNHANLFNNGIGIGIGICAQNVNEVFKTDINTNIDTNIETSIDNIISRTTQNLGLNTYNNIDKNENGDENGDENENENEEDSELLSVNKTKTMNQTEIQQLSPASIEVFNNALQQYLRITEECNTLSQALKLRNDAKNKLSETLKNFLSVNSIKTVNLEGSYKGKRIDTITTQSVGGFKRKTVTEALYNELKDEQELFDRIMTIISKTSIIKEKSSIKLINDKKTTTSRKASSKNSNILDTADALLNE